MKKTACLPLMLALSLALGASSTEAAKTPDDRLTITGDIRLLYVNYNHRTNYAGGASGENTSKYRTIRERVNINYRLDDGHTYASVGFYDNRVTDNHDLDRPFFINRAMVTGQYKKFGYTIGRQPYMGYDDYVLYAENIDGVKVRLGPRDACGEAFVGGVRVGKEYYHGFILKAYKEWKHWSFKSAYFDFRNSNRSLQRNHYQIWNNNLTYKFNDKINLQYDRINAWGENFGQRIRPASGYLVTLNWSNFDISKPNTFWFSLGYTHQPQGGYIMHSVMANPASYDWTYGDPDQGALGFKGIGIFYSHVIAKNTSLSLEYYDWKNINKTADLKSLRQKTFAAYLQYYF